ncbi:MAG: LacI family DNA-binding transcriptional regulator [Microbacteriaceae bacterium]
MTKRPTIHDVAARAGVSKSTAAVVFSSPDDVSPVRRERVLVAARELGYTPNAWARSLRSTSRGFVGIIVADFHNPLFTEIADAARQLLAAQGIFSFVASASIVDGPEGKRLDREPIQHLLDLKPQSLFIVGGLPDLSPFANLPGNIRVVVALSAATELSGAVTVRTDESAAMQLVCAHLAELGHQRIAYIGPVGRRVADDRRAAFLRAADQHTMSALLDSTGSAMDESSGADAAERVVQSTERPTAIVCYNDNVAFGVQNFLERAGNKTVAVTGYDNTYIARLERIALTSIEQNTAEIARKSCELLGDESAFARSAGSEILVAPELAIRSSTLSVAV